MIDVKFRIIVVSVFCALILCSCNESDDAGDNHITVISADSSIAEAVTSVQTTTAEPVSNDSSEEEKTASDKGDSSAYFPELLSSAAALDADSSLTDFDRMIKEVSTFDTKEFVKDHSYAQDHFTGRMFEYDKRFIIYDRKFFDGHWLYGNYILHLIHYIAEPQDSGIFVESIFNIENSAYVPRVEICHFDNKGEYIPLEKEVTRADIDEELHPYYAKSIDIDSVSDSVRRHENLFEDREEYHDDSFVEWFKEFIP